MKKIDIRCRPPIPSMANGGLFHANKKDFSTKFWGGPRDESAIKKDLDLMQKDMDSLDILGYMTLRKSGNAEINKEAAQLIEDQPELFQGAVGLDLHNIEEALADIETYVINGPFIGVNLEPHLPAPGHQEALMYLDDERIFPIYEKCQKYQLPVTITFGGPLGLGGVDKDPMRVHKVLTTFPHLKLGLTHGAWPMFNAMVGLLAAYPNLFICMDSYLMLPGWRNYVDAANYVCQDQLMFGTSYPLCSINALSVM